jgi:hypothetical protein
MLRRAFLGSAVLLAFLAGGCNSPTLPLPPPALPSVEATADPLKVRLASTRGAEPNAILVIINTNPAVTGDKNVGGATADADGSWFTEVYASNGDTLQISQEFGTTKSSPVTFVVRLK